MERTKRLIELYGVGDRVEPELEKIVERKEQEKQHLWNENRALIKKQAEERREYEKKELSQVRWPSSELFCELSKVVPKGKKYVQVYNESSKKNNQRVPMRMLVPVLPAPVMNYWVPIPANIKTKEQDALLNFPYLGEDTNNTTFFDDLVKDYNGRVHNNEQSAATNMDDKIFLELVDRLSMNLNIRCPSSIIFDAISGKIPDIGTADTLKKRYMQLKESPKNIVKCTPNIDEKMEKAGIGRDQALQAYHNHFCRRCFTYGCLLHGDGTQDVENPGPNMSKKPTPTLKPTEPCGPNCFLHLDQSKVKVQTSSEVWSGSDDTLFRVLYSVFRKNYCTIAKSMITKTCQQVYDYSQKTDVAVGGLMATPPPQPQQKKERLSNVWNAPSYKIKQQVVSADSQFETTYSYTPCSHFGACDANSKSCSCIDSLNFCEKFCHCPSNCRNRAPICRCSSSQCRTKHCPCYLAMRECDPDRCGCGAGNFDEIEVQCKNVGIQRGQQKLLKVAKSQVAGWGCFLGEDVKKSELISEYRGEIISTEEADRRGKVYDKKNSSFLFTLTNDLVIDATRYGNTIRFVNHSNTPNCYAKVLMVNGDRRIGLFAKIDLKKGQELFYNYGENFPI